MNTQNWYGFTVLSDNIPMQRAGIYLITHISSGRIYIGISGKLAHRIRQHGRPSGNESKVGRAIQELGAENFLATPIYYTLDNSCDGLEKIETALIIETNSIGSGFNVVPVSGRGGDRGEVFRLACRVAQNTAESIARRAMTLADRGITKKRGDAIRAAHARPEVKEIMRSRKRGVLTDSGLERLRAAQIINHAKPEIRARKADAMKAKHADQDFRERHLSSVRKANADPMRNSKISESRKGGMWITDGTNDAFQKIDAPISNGWYRGRSRNKKAA